MKLRELITLAIIIIVIMNSCKDDGTGPENLEPGRRDYVWTVDTLQIPFTYLEKMWGNSPDNVWAVGPGGGLSTTIWHYNGNTWATDGISRGISPRSVWGFATNDVWIAGREGRIWHFNGTEWQQSIWYTKQNWNIGFQEIRGSSPVDLYAVGYADSSDFRKAFMLHWNGYNWGEVAIPIYKTYSFVRMKRGHTGNYFLLGWGEDVDGSDMLALFEFDGKSIWKIYEDRFVSETWAGVSDVGEKLLFIAGNKICRYVNGKFQTIVEVDINKFNQGIWGRSEKDIIISMTDGIAHYNGIDIQYIYKYKDNEHAFDAVVLDKDIFILTNDFKNYSNIIIRGELP